MNLTGSGLSEGPDTNMHVGRVIKFMEQPEILFDFINSALDQKGVDIIVLDGQLQWLIKAVYLR